jgi:polyisoprenoid-binding protein YceI
MKTLTTLVACCAITTSALAAAPEAPLSLVSARVTVDGTSNVHPYTASSKAVRLTRVQLTAAAGGDVLQQALQPGAIGAFDIAVAAASLASAKGDIDKNMHKALKAAEHADITFRLRTLDTGSGEGIGIPLKATGTLTIAGVEREVTLDLQAQRKGETLTLAGGVDLLMTDFGVTPPKAMLGMLKTDPKVRVSFEVVVAAS